ncbi:malate dehydrogenase [Methyloterricola oryzae]|uniref:malate dehydrogenase n=1 Tax=Methyloterricola oryzae TaxID=1495050 RepID=UPI0005EBEF6A|nr:malate dehydrogenase [Methyloterricola oryzae]
MKTPVHIAITGAAGQISYALAFRLIAGDLAGPDQPLVLHLLEVPEAMLPMKGVAMELMDCASPLLADVIISSDPREAFDGADLVFLIGAKPRGPGMERRDLLQINAEIFAVQGQALNQAAKRGVKVLVVGNPANTNAMIALRNAPDLAPENFSAMTRLDHNRAVSQLASHCGCGTGAISRVAVWGNHSITQYPDLHHARVSGAPALEQVEQDWFRNQFIPVVQKRGAAVIEARGKSSAASAAHAALECMRDWMFGTPADDWVSMAVVSDGSYGVTPGLVYSFPVTVADGRYAIVPELPINQFSHVRMHLTEAELIAERDMVQHLFRY